MRINFILICLAAFILPLSCSQGQNGDDRGYIVQAGDMASDFEIKEAGGRKCDN
jgi:hypothetical protein